jgi:SAM-dependent methyltransferase
LASIADWDERYRAQPGLDRAPEPLLVATAGELPPGRALDLACGAGRHALYLARLGWRVTAVDGSRVAVAELRREAGRLGLDIDARVADLEAGEFVIEPGAYDLICDFFYLERALFPRIRAGVKPGGLFVATLHRFDGTPGPYLLQSGELREEFAGWKILYYSERPAEGGHRRSTAAIAARRA